MAEERKLGLARTLSKAGYCSRSRAAELVRAGRVSINDSTRMDPEVPVRKDDRVAVDGKALPHASRTYLMLNKPRGVVTTAHDEQGRRTIYDLLEEDLPWAAPVGRLDKASEGLLLITNDSEWASRLLDPESHVHRTYRVQINRIADEVLVSALLKGVKSGDDFLRVRSASLLRTGLRNSWLEIVLDEGKNRHIRRLLTAMEIQVLRLIRVAIGPVILGDLPKGKYRQLSEAEKKLLDRAMARAASQAGLQNP